jgi:small subunit ribosomal protein S11
MGKKRIVTKSAKEVLSETEKLESALKKEIKIKPSKIPEEAKIHILSTYNNTILNLTDMAGNTIYQTSAGKVGFSGTKKGTPYAASKAAEFLAEVVKYLNIQKIHVLVKGVGSGRDSALRTLAAKGLNILSIKDVTPIPHDGPRPKKVRRV